VAHTEAGGEKGVEALKRLEKVFGRVQSPWMPASGDETYEIIRRRLFQTLDSDGERARDETIKAFHDLYKDKKNAADFPPEAREGRYYDLLRMSYPIHPELFDRLSKDWASLPNFQRTRRPALHGECRRRLMASTRARPLHHARSSADCKRTHPRERALSARRRLRGGGR
jgi:hypothetical protein